ncbi:MAG: indolepyruvate ferredoxin oxidoreductase subunit alpha [Archaeoglobaceae archaeon]
MAPPLRIDQRLCDGCGLCVDVCPLGSIELDGLAEVDQDTCTDCGVCVDVCPNEAILLD